MAPLPTVLTTASIKSKPPSLTWIFLTFPSTLRLRLRPQPVYSKGTDELFVDKTNPNPQGDEDAVQVDQEKSIEDVTRHLKADQTVEEKTEETPGVQR